MSRAFGDIEAKMVRFGGNPNVLISKPEITTIKINKDHDFIFLGSNLLYFVNIVSIKKGDGIFDKLTNEEVVAATWNTWADKRNQNVHLALKNGVEHIIKESMLNKSLDNVTGILIAFSHLESFFDNFETPKKEVLQKSDLLDEFRADPIRDMRESPLHPSPFQRVPSSTQTPGLGPIDHSEHLKLHTPNKGHLYPQKAASDMFDFTKYMDSNARRGSDSLPRINQIKPKGY